MKKRPVSFKLTFIYYSRVIVTNLIFTQKIQLHIRLFQACQMRAFYN